MMRLFRLMTFVAIVAMSIGFANPLDAPHVEARTKPPSKAKPATLTGYIDGDKLSAKVGDASETLHLISADAPETNKWECEAFAGLDLIRTLVPVDAEIFVETGKVERDSGDRLYAWVWYNDGAGYSLLNEKLVGSGFAMFEKPDAGNDRYADEVKAAQEDAKKTKVGIWANCGGDVHKKSSGCLDVNQAVVDLLATALDQSAGGLWLRGAQAVREPTRVHVYAIAADIEGPGMEGDGEIGVWIISGEIDGSGSIGVVQATEGFANEFSPDLPSLGFVDTVDLKAWDKAQDCVKDKL